MRCLSAYVEMNKKNFENFDFCSKVSAFLIEIPEISLWRAGDPLSSSVIAIKSKSVKNAELSS